MIDRKNPAASLSRFSSALPRHIRYPPLLSFRRRLSCPSARARQLLARSYFFVCRFGLQCTTLLSSLPPSARAFTHSPPSSSAPLQPGARGLFKRRTIKKPKTENQHNICPSSSSSIPPPRSRGRHLRDPIPHRRRVLPPPQSHHSIA